MSWEEFCERFELDGTGGLKPSTVSGYLESLAAFQRICRPRGVSDLTTARVAAFARELRKPRTVKTGKGKKQREKTVQLSEASIARHLRHVKKISRWACRHGYLAKVPSFDMPKDATKMGGRPISEEEFHILLSAVAQVVGEAAAPMWRFLLRGFWTSGLRLREACNLHWSGNVGHVVDYSRKRPMFRISGEFEKAGRDRLLPMAPEFAKLLDTVPPEDRYGRVFELVGGRGQAVTNPHRIGRTVSLIGEASGIVTAHDPRTGESRKHATAHDLRRAFGFRWSRRVMPAVLMELMRHARIETTMKYYVGENADATAEEIWSLGNNPGNNRESTESEISESTVNEVVRAGVEPATPGFSVQCSTN